MGTSIFLFCFSELTVIENVRGDQVQTDSTVQSCAFRGVSGPEAVDVEPIAYDTCTH